MALVTDGRRISTGGDWFRIGQPNGDDAGRYRCQAANSQGQMESEFQLNVHGPLRARLEPQRQVCRVDPGWTKFSKKRFDIALLAGISDWSRRLGYKTIQLTSILTFRHPPRGRKRGSLSNCKDTRQKSAGIDPARSKKNLLLPIKSRDVVQVF